LYQDVDDENILTYVERWERKEDMDRHIRSDQYRKLIAVIDESVEPPDIRFDTISESHGIAAIWATRDLSAIQ
jgi:quinol monooxygenase YgiN